MKISKFVTQEKIVHENCESKVNGNVILIRMMR